MYFRDECFAKGTKNSWKEKDEIQGGSRQGSEKRKKWESIFISRREYPKK